MEDEFQGYTDLRKELYKGLAHALEKVEAISRGFGQFESHSSEVDGIDPFLAIDLIDQFVCILREIALPDSEFATPLYSDDLKLINDLADVFEEISQNTLTLYIQNMVRSTKANGVQFPRITRKSGIAGRPRYDVPVMALEELRGLGFSWSRIAYMFGISRWTIYRRIEEYDLQHLRRFSNISDEHVDGIIAEYISRHGNTSGEPYISGYLRSKGIYIQRRRIRASLNRPDPVNTVLRWGALISRRSYFVPWPNSLWHIDGHHSLIRWKFVIHGCIDGKSRKIMYLHCSTNNLAQTVLNLFLRAIEANCGYWPSRIRVDYGVENVAVCEAMVEKRGPGRGSFIAGSSTHNQRIERLWRDVFRCVCVAFYYTFYAMEQCGLLDVENPIHMFSLHLVFLPRINLALKDFMEAFNEHRLSTERNWTPNQIWMNGMMDPENPLTNEELDENLESGEMYGVDHQHTSLVSQHSNNIVVTPITISDKEAITKYVYEKIDPNRESSQMGIDVYADVLQVVVENYT